MKLFTDEQHRQLLENGRPENRDRDHTPVVKLFTPDAGATWLLTEIDPNELNIAFGLCDLGLGFPELGNVYLPELVALRGKLGLPIERDLHFTATHPLSVYARAARSLSGITASATDLETALQPK
jgi:hypothetical protein